MQEKYTEDIDKLNTFYQDNLREASVEPPPVMWDKISTSYAEQKKSSFSKNRILLLLLLLLLISATGVFFYLKNEKTVNKETGTVSAEHGKTNKETGIGNTEQENKKAENKKQFTKENKETVNPDQINSTAKKDSVHTIAPAVVETPKIVEEKKIKPDTTTNVVKEAPKKKMNFREKHTQNVKADSLRPLFVPVK